MRYTIVLTPEPDGSAVNVAIPAMPGVATWGRTAEEAIASAREAIALHLEQYAERGKPAPPDRAPQPWRLRLAGGERTVTTVDAGQATGSRATPPHAVPVPNQPGRWVTTPETGPIYVPDIKALPRERFRVAYDRPSDALLVDFDDAATATVYVRPTRRAKMRRAALRIESETARVVGVRIDDFLAREVEREPILAAALDFAELRGVTDAEAADLRRRGRAALERGDAGAFAEGIDRLIA